MLAAAEEFGRPSSRDAEGVDQTLRASPPSTTTVAVDAGSTLTASAVAALTVSDLVLLVANPDVPCLRNLQRLIDALRLAGVAPEQIRIVLNRDLGERRAAAMQIERVLGRTIDFRCRATTARWRRR